jgi:hypothetical protein
MEAADGSYDLVVAKLPRRLRPAGLGADPQGTPPAEKLRVQMIQHPAGEQVHRRRGEAAGVLGEHRVHALRPAHPIPVHGRQEPGRHPNPDLNCPGTRSRYPRPRSLAPGVP